MVGRVSQRVLLVVAAMLVLAMQAGAFVPCVPSSSSSSSSITGQRQRVDRRIESVSVQQQQAASSPWALWAKKNKESDVIEVDGIVKESLPNAKFRVELVATKAVIVCSTSGKMRKNFVRVLVGDPVKVELSPYDLTRGRITYRSRGPGKDNRNAPSFPTPDAPPTPPPPTA